MNRGAAGKGRGRGNRPSSVSAARPRSRRQGRPRSPRALSSAPEETHRTNRAQFEKWVEKLEHDGLSLSKFRANRDSYSRRGAVYVAEGRAFLELARANKRKKWTIPR